MPKVKDKENLKSSERKSVGYLQRAPIRLSADLSIETLQARQVWQKIFNMMKTKDRPTNKITLPARLSFRIEGQIKSLPDKEKLKEFIATKSSITRNVKGYFLGFL